MGNDGVVVDGHRIRPLGPRTWDAFAALAQKHNGVWGGCWCTWFHLFPDPPERRELGTREFKRQLVERDHSHAALVFDNDAAIAWAQFGPVTELPNIHHRKEWEQGVLHVPDYRITCLFVDRDHRRDGIAEVAVRGALELIAAAGGGLVESYPTICRRVRECRHRTCTTRPEPCTSGSDSAICVPRARATV